MPRIFPSLLLVLFFLTSNAIAAPGAVNITSDIIAKGPWVDVRSASSLSSAATYATTAGKPLHITKQISVTSNTDLSAVPEVDIVGGSFNVSSGVTLTLPANFHAGLVRVFSGAGTITFGSSGMLEVYPEWWGSDSAAFQAAATAASNRVLKLTRETYSVENIKLPGVLEIRGSNPKGASGPCIISANSSAYVLEAKGDTYFRYKISGVTLDCVNGIDLRTTSSSVVGLADVRDVTFIGGDGTGVGVNMINNDFSNVVDNSFYQWQGYCGILAMGWYGTNMNDFKATTQVDISRNVFSANQTIGVSVDVVNSIHIYQNDFGSTSYPIDVGGSVYFAHLPGGSGYYKRGEGTPANPTWGTFAGYGWFSDVAVHHNHLEYSVWSIVADGGPLTSLNKGLEISQNNIYFGDTQLGGISLKKTEQATLYNNIVDFRSNSTAECIKYTSTIALTLDKNRVVSSQTGATTTKSYVDGGGNFFSHIVKSATGGDYDDSANVTYGNFRSTDVQALSSTIPAGSLLPAKTASLFQKIQVAGTLSQTQQLTIFSVPSVDCSGIIIVDVIANGVGRTSSTWAVGKSTISRISTETSTPSIYSIKYNAGGTAIVVESAYNGTVQFEASGMGLIVTN